MVARNIPAEDSDEEEARHAVFARRRPRVKKALSVKKPLSAYVKARKYSLAMVGRLRKRFSAITDKITGRVRAVGRHKRIINSGLTMGVQILVTPFDGRKPSIMLKGLGGMSADQREAMETALKQVAAACVAHGKLQQVRCLTSRMAAYMLHVGFNESSYHRQPVMVAAQCIAE
jgi:hypothetical protein